MKTLLLRATALTLAGMGAMTASAVTPIADAWRDASCPPLERARWLVAAMTLPEKLALLEGDTVLDANGTGLNPCVGHISAIPRLGLPALCMGDGPAGVGNGLTGVTQFPAPIALAASFDAALARDYGVALGAEHAAKGRNVVLAPTINIIRTPKWGRIAETLSEDPYLTARLGTPIVAGIQSNGVIATPKHFAANNQEWLRLGDAPAYEAIDAIVSERALREIYYPAFHATIRDGGAGSVMCAYNRVNGGYACENPALLDVLRTDWKFDGFVVADWYFAHRSTVAAARAGMDISMPGGASPFGFGHYYGPPLARAVQDGTVPAATIDAMVTRIVTPMFRLGLVDRPVAGNADAPARSAAHSALARRIVEEGTVLLRNEKAVLPLSAKVRTIAVIGDDAGPNVQTTERYGGFVKSDGIAITSPLDAIRTRAGKDIAVRYAPGTRGVGPLPTMPADAFRLPDGSGAGLRATYYPSGDWSGRPILTRTEARIDQDDAIVKELPALWSARWEGRITPSVSGNYRFSLNGGGEIALYVDGKRVVYTPKQSFRLVTHGMVALTAGKPVSIRVDYSRAPTISPAELRLGWEVPDRSRIDAAVAAARTSDVAIVFAADMVSEGADRTDLRLPGDQDALIAAVAAANPRTVVVLHTAGPVLMPWRDKVAAILAAWYPGEEAATGLSALLFGDIAPTAKLPVTFPADETHGPADRPERYPGIGTRVRYDEGLLVGYRWYDEKRITPLYPFGHGLTYTSFRTGPATVETMADGSVAVRAAIRNSGARAGTQVAQLYLGFPANTGEPPRQLKGFQRITLAAGESREVRFVVAPADLMIWDEAGHRMVRPAGTFTAWVGGSSRDLGTPSRF
jgi:beta-glucosidase